MMVILSQVQTSDVRVGWENVQQFREIGRQESLKNSQ